jgi:hypothetical protein
MKPLNWNEWSDVKKRCFAESLLNSERGYCLLHDALATAAVFARHSGAFSSAEELDIIREGLFPFSRDIADEPIHHVEAAGWDE